VFFWPCSAVSKGSLKKAEAIEEERGSKKGAKQEALTALVQTDALVKIRFRFSVGGVTEGAPTKTPATQTKEKRRKFEVS
jgi:hypothetical protein